MRRNTLLIFATVLLLTATAVALQASDERPGPPPQPGFGPPHSGPGGPPPGLQQGPGDFGGHSGARRRPWAGHGDVREQIEKLLGLTPQQLQEMRKLRADYRDRTRKARTTLYSLHDEKTTMLSSGKIDMQKLAKIDEELVKARTDILRERLRVQRDRLALLSEEQRARMGDFLGRKRDHFRSAGPHTNALSRK